MTDFPDRSTPAGLKSFAGDSFGYTSSQLDLSSFAGQTIKPQFTLRGDGSLGYIGWWLDDIVVHTCDAPPPPSAMTPPTPTAPPAVVQLSSSMKLKVKTGKSVKIVASVETAGSATGTVSFKIDKLAVKKTVTIKNGRATLKLSKKKLTKLGKGKHKVKASYSGSTTAKASKAKATFNLR